MLLNQIDKTKIQNPYFSFWLFFLAIFATILKLRYVWILKKSFITKDIKLQILYLLDLCSNIKNRARVLFIKLSCGRIPPVWMAREKVLMWGCAIFYFFFFFSLIIYTETELFYA